MRIGALDIQGSQFLVDLVVFGCNRSFRTVFCLLCLLCVLSLSLFVCGVCCGARRHLQCVLLSIWSMKLSLCACCVFFHLVLLEDGLRLGQSEEKFYIDKGKVLEFTENGSGSQWSLVFWQCVMQL